MIILITNDDGIDAPGLAALKNAVAELGEIYTIAPAGAMSQVGHRVTTHQAIPVEQRDERSWAVTGTPADCVRVAIANLLPEPPDWVLSGINQGGNMGHDIYISGTVAAVREAAYHGYRGIAVSHYCRRELPLDWEVAGRRAGAVIGQLVKQELTPGEHWNVNLPHVAPDAGEPQPREAHPESAPLHARFEESEDGLRYTGIYGDRPHHPGSDVAVCFGGDISVTKLRL